MLVVLSELNCIGTLNRLKIFPDEFYTDFEAFKANIPFMMDAYILIIFMGSYAFRKRLVIEQFNLLKARADNPDDTGINKVFVLSDASISSLKEYYKFSEDINKVYHMNKNKEKEGVNFWSYIGTLCHPKEARLYLSEYDRGIITSESKKRWEERGSSEDEYIKLIKTPNIKNIMNRPR